MYNDALPNWGAGLVQKKLRQLHRAPDKAASNFDLVLAEDRLTNPGEDA